MKTGLDERERLGRIHGYNQRGNSKDPSKQKQRYMHLVLALKCTCTRSGNGGCPPSNLINPEHSEPIKSCARTIFCAHWGCLDAHGILHVPRNGAYWHMYKCHVELIQVSRHMSGDMCQVGMCYYTKFSCARMIIGQHPLPKLVNRSAPFHACVLAHLHYHFRISTHSL